jgi:hypothetical protein
MKKRPDKCDEYRSRIFALRSEMRDVEEMLRHPPDPFVLINCANLLAQSLARDERERDGE